MQVRANVTMRRQRYLRKTFYMKNRIGTRLTAVAISELLLGPPDFAVCERLPAMSDGSPRFSGSKFPQYLIASQPAQVPDEHRSQKGVAIVGRRDCSADVSDCRCGPGYAWLIDLKPQGTSSREDWSPSAPAPVSLFPSSTLQPARPPLGFSWSRHEKVRYMARNPA
jgi:hypothetical protein